MAVKTENLTILFVDIAGFTVTTSRQSREENAALLETFENTLHPLIKAFKGNLVKSIGDALLITVRSPTDAMLCAMAMQDAMHEHNLTVSESEKIHIRVAANLGEVRVTKKDIFGEPVNVAARIEGVTPSDEIYLSEAVYMAMNKAEVPAQEVGFKELSGVSQAVRLYSIPRFATARLVPEPNEMKLSAELQYPYGGMHHQTPPAPFDIVPLLKTRQFKRSIWILGSVLLGSALAFGAWQFVSDTLLHARAEPPITPISDEPAVSTQPITDTVNSAVTNNEQDLNTPTEELVTAKTITPDQSPPAITANETLDGSAQQIAINPTASVATPPKATEPTKAPIKKENTAPLQPKKEVVTSPQATQNNTEQQPQELSKPAQEEPTQTWSINQAKQAYKNHTISKAEYKTIVNKLEDDYDSKIRALKLQYKAGKIDRATYDAEVRKAKKEYAGN